MKKKFLPRGRSFFCVQFSLPEASPFPICFYKSTFFAPHIEGISPDNMEMIKLEYFANKELSIK